METIVITGNALIREDGTVNEGLKALLPMFKNLAPMQIMNVGNNKKKFDFIDLNIIENSRIDILYFIDNHFDGIEQTIFCIFTDDINLHLHFKKFGLNSFYV